MSPADERYQRWHMRTCARCGRYAGKAANWSDGPICRTCLDRALKSYGPCPGCGADRLLPGRNTAGQPVCRDCAGITRNFTCTRCQAEGYLRAGLCRRCTLTDDLRILLDDGTGQVNPRLVPLFDQLATMANPASGQAWISKPQPRALLTDLARGRLELTHEAFAQLPNGHTVTYLLDLLTSCGILEPVDRQILLFKRAFTVFLATVTNPEHAQLLNRYATWQQLRRLRGKAAKGPLIPSQVRHMRDQLVEALDLLTFLDEHGPPLAQTRQADLDRWMAHRRATGNPDRGFLTWAMNTHQMPGLRIPSGSPRPGAPSTPPMGQQARIDAIRRLATDTAIPLRTRVAGALVLLYAQPVARIVRLRVDDIQATGEQMLLRIGDPPVPVPPPIDTLIGEYLRHRPNLNTAANPETDCPWLFPGRRPGQPMHPTTMVDTLQQAGINPGAARVRAIRDLVTQIPPPVVANALGYHQVSTARIANQTGNPWSGYAAGDHTP